MKIAFISESFPPYAPGGAEWSTYYLAKGLMELGQAVTVITPNYGSRGQEFTKGMKIIHFPFYQKLKNENQFLGNFFFTNPLWYLWSTLFYFYYLLRGRYDLIHIHGKYSIPSIFLANIWLRKPVLATIRDYQVICNYGMCLTNKDKACTLKEYFFIDFLEYYRNYVKNKNIISLVANLLFSVWGRISRNFLLFFARRLIVVALSSKQKEIFVANGFRKVFIVGNSTQFPNLQKMQKRENQILFAGRLSKGKGVEMMINIIPQLFSQYPGYRLVFAGEGLLKERLTEISKVESRVKVLGQVRHDVLLNLYRQSKLVIVPSLWPEPFGRIALEALSRGTPTVVTNKGGLPEIIRNGRWGVVVPATPQGLLRGIEKGLKQHMQFVSNIENDMEKIKAKFGADIAKKYLRLYQEVIK